MTIRKLIKEIDPIKNTDGNDLIRIQRTNKSEFFFCLNASNSCTDCLISY